MKKIFLFLLSLCAYNQKMFSTDKILQEVKGKMALYTAETRELQSELGESKELFSFFRGKLKEKNLKALTKIASIKNFLELMKTSYAENILDKANITELELELIQLVASEADSTKEINSPITRSSKHLALASINETKEQKTTAKELNQKAGLSREKPHKKGFFGDMSFFGKRSPSQERGLTNIRADLAKIKTKLAEAPTELDNAKSRLRVPKIKKYSPDKGQIGSKRESISLSSAAQGHISSQSCANSSMLSGEIPEQLDQDSYNDESFVSLASSHVSDYGQTPYEEDEFESYLEEEIEEHIEEDMN